MSEIVIHGASSFIGKHLVKRLLANGIKFRIIAREKSNLPHELEVIENCVYRYASSLNEVEITDLESGSIFIELSWHGVFGSQRNEAEQITVNIPLTISSITTANRLKSKHWIGFGSQAEYGNLNKRISESENCNPTTLYGKSKLQCSQIALELTSSLALEFTWLRLFSVFGPDDNHEWFIQYLIREMLVNTEINVTKAEQCWDYLYIDDIIDMLLKLFVHKGLGVTNLGSGSAIQLKNIIEYIRNKTNSTSQINYGAVPYRPDQVMYMEADNTKLKSALNWQPKTSIEEGLNKTIHFYTNKYKALI